MKEETFKNIERQTVTLEALAHSLAKCTKEDRANVEKIKTLSKAIFQIAEMLEKELEGK